MSSSTEAILTVWDAIQIHESGGFWYGGPSVDSVNAFRSNFQPVRDDVVVLASMPKAGTTWLKSLSHCILFHRQLFHTHVPYSNLPDSIKNHSRGCKLVYVAREPKDTLVSAWHFYNKILRPFPIERAVENFCSGMVPYGPFHEHMLEYWEQSKTSPDKVMFIKYEDLRRDPKPHVRKLASFMGRPFDEEDDEEVEKVIWRSSFDRLKDLDVNKDNNTKPHRPLLVPLLKNSHFFRRGKVGDWRNHLTSEMAERIDDVTRVKLQGTGLYLEDEEVAIA
ncbi:Cytosolic sulfotransferase 17 [Linum perenne]